MSEPNLFPGIHDGVTFETAVDGVRLNAQTERVFKLMRDALWRTLKEIAVATGDPEASISARLRDLRKFRFGAFQVNRRRRGEPKRGIWEYQLVLPERGDAPTNATNGGAGLPPVQQDIPD